MLPKSILIKKQVKIYGPKEYTENGERYLIEAAARYDDECGNGHNTFALTGGIKRRAGTRWAEDTCGCIHEEIVRHFPQLAPLVKWHLTSSDGPMHYVGNTVYLAGDRDCWGKRKGEEKDFKTSIHFNDVPIPFEKYNEKFVTFLKESYPDFSKLMIREVPHKPDATYKWQPKYTYAGFGFEWWECPFDSKPEADRFTEALKNCKIEFRRHCVGWGEGKERELNAARKAAVWEDATDEELSADPNQLTEKLLARLPALMTEFKRAMESLGFVY